MVDCSPNTCNSTQVAFSDRSEEGSITGTTGDMVTVNCDAGYGNFEVAECQSNGGFTTVTCVAQPCQPTQVAFSDFAGTGSITGVTGATVAVTCNDGYSGSATTTCGENGQFSVVECSANICAPTQIDNSNKATAGSITGVTGG